MRFAVATLCDFAQVREGLLFVSGGGITRANRSAFPADLGLMLALSVEVSEAELSEPLEIRVRVENEDGEQIAQVVGVVQGSIAGLDPGELTELPMPLDLRGVGLPEEGRYMIRVTAPGWDLGEVCMSFRALLVAPEQTLF